MSGDQLNNMEFHLLIQPYTRMKYPKPGSLADRTLIGLPNDVIP
jgi:hypothetical protein